MPAQKRLPSDWTEEHVARLWDWYGSQPQRQEICFSNQVGQGIINFAKATNQLQGKVLDFGCGAGHLLGRLLEEKLECFGLDTSRSFTDLVNDKYRLIANWRGAECVVNLPSTYPASYFDVVFCVEVLEHVTSDTAAVILGEIRRVLKPNGIAIVTTPFSEVLDSNTVYCPFCNSEFHRMQHFRSVTVDDLTSQLEAAGYQVIFCRNLDFVAFQTAILPPGWRDWSYNSLAGWVTYRRRIWRDRVAPRPFPRGRVFNQVLGDGAGNHLCAVVQPRPQVAL